MKFQIIFVFGTSNEKTNIQRDLKFAVNQKEVEKHCSILSRNEGIQKGIVGSFERTKNSRDESIRDLEPFLFPGGARFF